MLVGDRVFWSTSPGRNAALATRGTKSVETEKTEKRNAVQWENTDWEFGRSIPADASDFVRHAFLIVEVADVFDGCVGEYDVELPIAKLRHCPPVADKRGKIGMRAGGCFEIEQSNAKLICAR